MRGGCYIPPFPPPVVFFVRLHTMTNLRSFHELFLSCGWIGAAARYVLGVRAGRGLNMSCPRELPRRTKRHNAPYRHVPSSKPCGCTVHDPAGSGFMRNVLCRAHARCKQNDKIAHIQAADPVCFCTFCLGSCYRRFHHLLLLCDDGRRDT